MIEPEVLARIPGCADQQPPLAVARLPGGQGRNLVLRVDTSAGRFVLRCRLPPWNRPGAAALTELRAHRLAAAAGLAPAVLDAASDGSWILMEYIDAPCWTPEQLCSARGVEQLGGRLAVLHALAVPAGVPVADPEAMAAGYLERAATRDPESARALQPLAAQISRLGERLADAGEQLVPVHGDIMASNMLGTLPLLVDWEYAQAADPTWDLACLLSYYPQIQRFLEVLLESADCAAPQDRARLQLQRERFTLLNRLWDAAYPAS